MAASKFDILINTIFKEQGLDQVTKKLNNFINSSKSATAINKRYNQLTKGMQNVSKRTELANKRMAATQVLAERLGIGYKGLKNYMNEAGLTFTQNAKFANKATGTMVNQQNAIKRLTGIMQTHSDQIDSQQAKYGKLWRKEQTERIEQYARKNAHLNMSAQTLGSTLNKLNYSIDKNGNVVNNSTGQMVRQDMAQHRIIQSTKRFRMELLSVMFFGMAIQRFFGALTKGSLEASGAMDVWSAITMLMGLPVALKITDALIKMLNWWGKLSPAMKKTISTILWAGFAFGTLIMVIGTLGLGLGGVAKVLSTLFPAAVAKFSAAWAAAGGGVSAIIKVLLPKILSFAIIVIGAFRAISGFLAGNWWKIISGILMAVAGIVAFVFGGWIPALIAAAVAAFVWLGDKVPQVAGLIMAAVSPVVYVLTGLYDILKGIIGLIQGKSLKEAFDFGTVKEFTAQMTAKLEGKESPTTKLAAGGIVTRPINAIVGEAGPEAVIPLNRGNLGNTIDYNPNIIIHANISNDMDIENVAKRVNEYLYSDLRGVSFR
jgi:hypothetical protein